MELRMDREIFMLIATIWLVVNGLMMFLMDIVY